MVFEPNAQLLDEILLGIEEEGALFEVKITTISNVKKSSYNAAYQSQVEIGIGISGSRAALTAAKLSENKPLYEISSFDKKQWRYLGANAARLVSKRPMINIYTNSV